MGFARRSPNKSAVIDHHRRRHALKRSHFSAAAANAERRGNCALHTLVVKEVLALKGVPFVRSTPNAKWRCKHKWSRPRGMLSRPTAGVVLFESIYALDCAQ
jgi:ribosomal protein L22